MEQIVWQVKYPPTASTERARPSRIDSSSKYLVYCISNSVIVRHLEDLNKYSVFDQHKFDTTAVAISPNGNLCCSGDAKGSIMVWELNIQPHPVFRQYEDVLGGAIKDICWTGDGERLGIVGEGKTYFGRTILLDTGSSVGEISGVSLTLNACAMRPQRPFRLALGGDEGSVCWFEGPPFKFKKSMKQHNNSILQIKYNQSGDHFVSVGADKKIYLYEGKTGEVVKEITTDSPHTRSITGVSWINDTTFVTSSNDTTLKVWNFDGLLKTLKIPNAQEIDDMQVGVTVSGNVAYSLSLTGALNVWLDVLKVEEGPTKRLFGHNALVGQIAVYGDKLITGDNNGRLLIWENGNSIRPAGVHHTKQVISLSVSQNVLYSLGGEQLKLTNLETNTIEKTTDCKGLTLKLQANQSNPNICYLLMENGLILEFTNLELTREYQLGYEVSNFLLAESLFLVGDLKGKIHAVSIESGAETQTFQLQQTKITAMALQGDRFLCGDTTGKMKLIDYKENQVVHGDRWTHHTTIISSLSFTNSGKFAVSTGYDNKIMVWNLQDGQRVLERIDAHKRGVLTAIITSDNKVLSSGGDNSFKEWVLNLE
ncbi:unnamed protein product (macronuclear) [Paramecium tetraurelia]|uniref:Anaphase-promoting complex subunit 4 WD40 domain-containing protein n=1 Tax=Paramecium tetraurelia TaxID=5888 RepID=A0ECQ4_PARTE|nr:uncharacterized protein GSPATT00003940001 [Paramecium tetraurelia]CAK93071.1 unnamed protein product [Paramecium tetraurelia]|eukprot:XP_001460468.1 hypothetical protein (macronuclear) [Paramecium tetraurelia strain d4-2]